MEHIITLYINLNRIGGYNKILKDIHILLWFWYIYLTEKGIHSFVDEYVCMDICAVL